jgi:predicted DNA-binding protein (UPF0251 family)
MPPRFGHFKPAGVPKRFLERVDLTVDEFEAIRLADYEQLEHLEASEKMNISRSTFTRLIDKARQKLASAIIEGKELVIDGGNVDFVNTLRECKDCGETSPGPADQDVGNCPDCGSPNVEDIARRFRGRRGRRGRRDE